MGTLSEAVRVEIEGDASHFDKSMKGIKKTSKGTVSAIAGDFKSMGKAIGKSFLVAGAAVGAFATYAVAQAIKSEKAFAEFASLYDEPTEKLEKFKDTIKDFSKTYGQSFTDMTRGFYQAASAGFGEFDQAYQLMDVAAMAAVAGNVELEVATEALTRVLNAYGKGAEDAALASDLLFQTVKLGQTEFKLLAPYIGQVAGLAAKAEVPMTELFASIAEVSKTLPTAQTITGIRNIISTFLKPSEAASKFAKEYKVGLDAATLASKGMIGSLLEMKDLAPEELAKLFDKETIPAVMAMVANEGANVNDKLKQMENAAGATEAAWLKMSDTMAFQLQQMGAEFNIFMQEIGESLLPMIKELGSYILTDLAPVLKDWAGTFSELVIATVQLVKEGKLMETIWASVKEVLWGAFEGMVSLVDNLFSFMHQAGGEIVGAIWSGIQAGWGAFATWFKSVWKEIIDVIKAYWSDFWSSLTDLYESQPPKTPGFYGMGMKATGGEIGGRPGTDRNMYGLTRGEHVMNVPASRANRPALEAMNAGSRYFDASVNHWHMIKPMDRRFIRDKVVPELARAKKAGYGVSRSW